MAFRVRGEYKLEQKRARRASIRQGELENRRKTASLSRWGGESEERGEGRKEKKGYISCWRAGKSHRMKLILKTEKGDYVLFSEGRMQGENERPEKKKMKGTGEKA